MAVKDVDPNKALTPAGSRGRDRVVSGSLGAGVGAAIGTAVAPGIGTAIGAGIGGLAGLIFGDENTVLPVDMIAIPAFEAYLIQGEPSFRLYIRAGETIVPTGGNVDDVQLGIAENVTALKTERKKPMQKSAWHKYIGNKKNQIRYKSGSKKGLLNMKAMSREYKKKRK